MDKPESPLPSSCLRYKHRVPTELQFAILEFLPPIGSRNSPQLFRTIACVCHDWRDWAYETLFRNIEIEADIRGLRALTNLCTTSAESSQQLNLSHERVHRDLGSFIRFIAVNIGQATGHGIISLSDLIPLFAFTTNLEDLCLTVVQPESVIDALTNTKSPFLMPSLSSLRIKSFEKTSRSTCLIASQCPSLKHLALEFMVEQPIHDPMGSSPPSELISFRSLGCFDPGHDVLDYFVLKSSEHPLRAIELHRAQSPVFLAHLAKTRGSSIESITLRSMEPSIVRTWETIISHFTALQHLSIWGMPSSLLLQSICASDLQYFEFRRPWTHSYRDIFQLNELVSFLKACPALNALKYHSAKPIEVIDELATARGLEVNWNENYQIDGYMEDGDDTFNLGETQAIARYIDRIAPSPSLTDANLKFPEKLWELVSIIAGLGFKLTEVGVVKPRLKSIDEGKESTEACRAHLESSGGVQNLRDFFQTLESLKSGDGPYLLGSNPTWPDFFLFPLVSDLLATPDADLAPPSIVRWSKEMENVRGIKETHRGTLADGGRP
ncbi:unnamed protein product [Rhizoctonia solani]|uniref:Glutathione S-transferase C-terminal domain-containing protein n=1 Tax=Rhizoctonia solani TaxID=456999 RepID=A0A8H2XQQ9_9AGAM|nr:unnamed protein product [Rhizoctonia solani]